MLIDAIAIPCIAVRNISRKRIFLPKWVKSWEGDRLWFIPELIADK